jgi:thiosulfate/3-mercaptopyruvate sulfurtransferase
MKSYKILALLAAIILYIPLFGQDTDVMVEKSSVITAAEFMKMNKANKELVIIDAGKSYDDSHIKKAMYINPKELNREDEVLKGALKSVEDLAAYFGEKGVAHDAEIVLYDEGSQKYSSRVYWILKYLGAENVSILHKDLDEWRNARVLLTEQVPSYKATTFIPNVNPEISVDLDQTLAAIEEGTHYILDVRTADEFNGVEKSDGHIPGAVHINYEDMLTETGAFKSAQELEALLTDAGIDKDTGIIIYCKTGVKATVAYVALKDVLLCEDVKVYDGAYEEWVLNYEVVK